MKQFSMAILIAAVCAMSSAYAANSVVNKVVKVKVITAGSPTPITVQYSEKAFYTDGESDRNSNPLDLKSDNPVISTSSYSSESLKQFTAKVTWQGQELCHMERFFSPYEKLPQYIIYVVTLSQQDGIPYCKVTKVEAGSQPTH